MSFLERRQREKIELDDRVGKMHSFITGEKFTEVGFDLQASIWLQYNAMVLYQHHLSDVIHILKEHDGQVYW
jgi:hypothetical protein